MLRQNGLVLYMMPEYLESHLCATNLSRVRFVRQMLVVFITFTKHLKHYRTLLWLLAGGQRIPLPPLYDDTLP